MRGAGGEDREARAAPFPDWPVILVVAALSLLSPSALAAADQKAVLAFAVNDSEKEDLIVWIRGDDILVRVADLQRSGLIGFGGVRETIAGEPYVSLRSLGPGFRFALDEKDLAVRLTAPASRLRKVLVDLGVDRPQGIEYSKDSSVFANYSFNSSDFRRFSAFGELGWSYRGNLLSSTVFENEEGSIVRGLSSYMIDQPERLTRWTIGDRFAETGLLGGGAFIGGISVSRNFNLDPYFVRFPRFGLSGAVSTPSTVDVYVNGTLVRRERLAPGPFELQNLPVTAGSGSTRLVVRDAFGQEREITSPYYFSTGVLGRGLSDYSYSFGLLRENLATKSADYGRLSFLGRHRVGLTDSVTIGGRLEASAELVSGGPSVTMRLPFGEVELAAAASRQSASSGAAASVGYTYLGRAVSLGGVVRAGSDHYANTSLSSERDRPKLEMQGSVGFPVSARITLAAQYVSSTFRDGDRRRAVSLSTSVPITSRANLFVSGGRSRSEDRRWTTEVFAGMSYRIGPRTTGSLSYENRAGGESVAAEVQSPLLRDNGVAYLLALRESAGREEGHARVQYQGPFGRYELGLDRTGNESLTTLNVSGGLVGIGGNVYATRPVQESFALLRVPGLEGIRGFSSNQSVGRTGSSGNLLVTDLLSYYGNRLSIADQDVPIDYAIDRTERVIAPPFRGGALVPFPVRKIRSVTGRIVIQSEGGETVPAFGQLTVEVEGRSIVSPLGRGGEFYLDGVSPGTHPATVEYREGVCRFRLDIAVSNEPFRNLGQVVCSMRTRSVKR